MSRLGNGPPQRRHSAARRRQREAQILDAFERLRRSDRRVYDILSMAIRCEGVRILHAVGVLVSCASRPARRRAQCGTNRMPAMPRSPR
jgi:hypothetical protein